MIIDGRAIAADILGDVKNQLAPLGREAVVRAIVVQPSAVTQSYLLTKSKAAENAGMRLEVIELSQAASTEEVIEAVQTPGADAVLVQLPLPDSMDRDRILDAIPREQDADILSSPAYARFTAGETDALLPPVAEAVREVCARTAVEVRGKDAVVVGNGRLVGEPVAVWLTHEGACVTVLTHEDSLEEIRTADFVVLGAGSPHLVTKDFLKEGVVVIDAGTSESNGSIVGDADPACAEIASVFTPVPGGMGPIAVACLFKNAAKLALRGQAPST